MRLIVPEEGATDAAYQSGSLTLATDASNFAIVQDAALFPLSGKELHLRSNDLTQRVGQMDDNGSPVYLGGQRAVLGKLRLPRLLPSTTYELVLSVRTVDAPSSCPKVLIERIARFTTESENAIGTLDLTRGSQPPAGTMLSGSDVLHRTRELLLGLSYPPFVSFAVNVRATIGAKPFAESFQSIVRTRDDIVATHSIPFATTNKPENPYGTDIMILGLRLHPTRHNENHEEPFGVPQISPLYSFGLRPPGEIMPSLFPTPEPEATDIRSLGRIESFAREYDVTLAGIEPYGPRYVYHLVLRPVSEPTRYRIRDLWVDTQTFVPLKLRSAGIFPQGQAAALNWDVAYTVVNGFWLMDREWAETPVRTGGGFLAATKATVYEGLTYSFSDFAFPKQIFDFAFFNSGDSEAVEF